MEALNNQASFFMQMIEKGFWIIRWNQYIKPQLHSVKEAGGAACKLLYTW
jgi:hypothetical protein